MALNCQNSEMGLELNALFSSVRGARCVWGSRMLRALSRGARPHVRLHSGLDILWDPSSMSHPFWASAWVHTYRYTYTDLSSLNNSPFPCFIPIFISITYDYMSEMRYASVRYKSFLRFANLFQVHSAKFFIIGRNRREMLMRCKPVKSNIIMHA